MLRPFILLPLLVMALSGGAAAQEVGDAQRGRDFAGQTCAPCHAIGMKEGPSPVAGAPPFAAVAQVPGMTATALFVTLQSVHREMPMLVLEDDELRDVVAYILTLKD